MVYLGAWGKLIHKKTWSRKSRGTVPLKNLSIDNTHNAAILPFDCSCAAYIGIGGMKIENEPRH